MPSPTRESQKKVNFPPVTATIRVEIAGGKAHYFEACERCNAYPIVAGATMPQKPIRTEKDQANIIGLAGGILPVYVADGPDRSAACNCMIGSYKKNLYNIPFYDSLPGTGVEDTKHSLVMEYFKKLKAKQLPRKKLSKSAPRKRVDRGFLTTQEREQTEDALKVMFPKDQPTKPERAKPIPEPPDSLPPRDELDFPPDDSESLTPNGKEIKKP